MYLNIYKSALSTGMLYTITLKELTINNINQSVVLHIDYKNESEICDKITTVHFIDNNKWEYHNIKQYRLSKDNPNNSYGSWLFLKSIKIK